MSDRTRELECVIADLKQQVRDAEKERDALRAKIETAENDAAHQKALAASALRVAEGWERKCGELRAKVAEMGQQEPVGVLHVGSYYGEELQDWEFEANQCACDKLNEAYVRNPMSLPLYALPGAQAQPAPSVPDGWNSPTYSDAQLRVEVGIAHEGGC